MKNKLILVALSLYSSLVFIAQTVPSSCSNLDFSQGNFNNWEGYTSVYSPTVAGTNVSIPWHYTQGIVPGRHTIMSTSVADPYTCNSTNTLPPNSKFCARLGNGGINPTPSAGNAWTNGDAWQIDVLTYTISVTPTSNLLTYRFAVILQDPYTDPNTGPHDPSVRPRFIVTITDKLTGKLIDPICGKFEVISDSVVYGLKNCTFSAIINAGGNPSNQAGTVYSAWTTVGVDLIKYLNKDVILKFETWDCGLGGHFGYAYVSATCDAFKLKTSGCLPSAGVKVSAPEGFSYLWQPGGETTKDIIAYTNNPGDSVTVTLTSLTGCKTTLSTKLYPTRINAKFNVNDSVICVNESINFSDFSTSSNINNNAVIPIVQWDWRFGDGQIGSGTTITHSYSSAGTYTAHLVVTNQTDCMDSITKIITVNTLPTVAATSNSTLICVGESATLTAVGANTYSWNPGGTGTNITVSPTVTTTYTVTGTNANGCINTAIVTQSVDLCANSVATQGVKYFIPNIYPNPTKGLFTIELNANTQIIITNIFGQEILNEKRIAGKQLFDIQNQVNGIYFVKIGLLIKKIIKD